MKKLLSTLMLLILFISGCTTDSSNSNGTIEKNNILVYFAKGETWATTYTLIDAGESIFHSLYIQHIGDREAEWKLIEYVLEGNGMEMKSQYPQELAGVRSFQVSGEYNKQLLNNFEDKNQDYRITIKQNGNSEDLILKLISE